jgi:preprotein translocase subunit YajC
MFFNNALADADTITIQDSETVPDAPPPVESGLTSLIPMILIFVIFYFLLIRPQEKKRRAQENLVSGVKRGEEILTTSGIYGIVSQINDSDNTVMLKVSEGVEMKILKNSIIDIVSRNKEEKSSDTKVNSNKKKKYFAKKNPSGE